MTKLVESLRDQGIECGPRCCATMGLANIAGIALLIIGCVGAAGIFPGSSIGWITVGLGGGGFALNLASGILHKRRPELISAGLLAAALVTVGALGGAGILSTTQVGWGIIGTTLASFPLVCVLSCFKTCSVVHELEPVFTVIETSPAAV